MDKQQISRQLQRLAQEEIPDTMNLWPRIQGQLKRKSKPRSFSLAYAISGLVMLLLVGVGGFAAYRSSMTIADAPIAANETTPLAMIQTIGGVTMSLDWAYADAHGISVQYTVVYNPQEVYLPDFSMVNLRTADGLLLPQDFGSGGGGGGGGGDNSNMSFTNQVNFDASLITANPQTLDLVLLVQYTENLQMPYEIQFLPTVPPLPTGINEPKGDIFTETPMPFNMALPTPVPLGEFQPTVPPPDMLTIVPSLIPPMQFTPTPVPASNANIFVFTFSVPFYPAKTGQIEQASIESNGIKMDIQNLSITPLSTRFELCYNLPDSQTPWLPKIGLDTGFAPSANIQGAMPIPSLTGRNLYGVLIPEAFYVEAAPSANLCIPMTSFAPFSPEGGVIDIQVDYLYRIAPPTDPATWEADIAFFRERGFDLTYGMSDFNQPNLPSNVLQYPIPEVGVVMVTIHDAPGQLDEWEVWTYISENMLKERVIGDWNFHVVVD